MGESSILIRPFERKQFYKENINYDFLGALGIESDRFDTFKHSRETLNISMNGQALVFKKLINRYLPLRPYQLKNSKDIFGTWRGTHISKALGSFPLEASDKAFQVMSYAEKAAVLKDVEAGNQAIEKQFFAGESMYSESMPEKDIVSYDDLEAEQIKEVAVFAFKGLMDKLGGVNKEYLLAGVAAALDAFDEYDRYFKLFNDDRELVKKSGFFDEVFYLRTNPALPEKTDVILHYLMIGHKENADPSEKFSTERYKLDYPEVCEYDMCPLVHYLRIGKAEGKKPRLSEKPKLRSRVEKVISKILNRIFD